MNYVFFDLAGKDFPGGCEKYFTNLARFFAQKHQVTFLQSRAWFNLLEQLYRFINGHTPNSIKYLDRDAGAVKVQEFPLKAFIPFTQSYRDVTQTLRNADSIYVKNEFQELAFLFYWIGKKQFSQKVIIGVHTAIFVPHTTWTLWKTIHDLQYYSFFYTLFIRSAKAIHVPNKDYIQLLADTYGINSQKVTCIPNPIDWKTQLKKSVAGPFRILWLGRLTQQKGIDRFVEIIRGLAQNSNFSKMEILIAGDGELKPTIEALATELKNVKYLGFVNDIEPLYDQVDACISTFYSDIFAHAVLEPQSFGIPSISFNIAGPRDIIINDETGYLVETVDEFVKKLLLLVKKKQQSLTKYNSYKKDIFTLTNKRFEKNTVFKRLEKYFYSMKL